ncbi:DNA ligase 1 isoform X1 [Brassica napus]|uniref:DNA ligase 1 isoform X1 n=1 Tax=Brassica napus TaxID=3708 RepID=UPI0006AB3FA3|nr:DNA ligase 1 isoform X1 [Brassica napus]
MVTDKQLSPIGGSSVPVPNRMLRLLKKATSISDLCPGSREADGEDLEKDGIEKDEMRSDLEGLGVEEGVNARKALDFDSVPELSPVIEDLGEKSEEAISEMETREETRVSEIDSASEESGEKIEEEICEMETRDSESSVPEIDPASEEMSEGGEEEIPEMKTRVSESSVPEIDPAIEDLGEKIEEEISDLETREETRVSESSESEESGEKGDEEVVEMETEEEIINVWGSKGVRKKRSVVLEASDSQGKEAKRSKKKTVDFDELPASMNMTKKERREYLDQLRAENQRLLRETRDAAFEPVPLVRKPISSVLEKIRLRKEEISKQFLSRKKSNSKDIDDGPYGEDVNDFEEVVIEEENEDVNLEFTSNQNPDGEDCLEDSAGPLGKSDSPTNKKAESNSTHQVNDFEDPSLRSQTTNFGEELLEKTSTRSVEEVMAPPSVPANNLKRNPSPAPDNSEEAEYTKESYDPETHDSSPGDPVRKFIDEVAEEEDDSDNDLLRFEDDDDDEEEDEEDDDLRDMIASQFKEDPSDKYKRNELHQKWLEQQDAAGTEKLLHKLKRGLQQDETSLFEDEDDDADGEEMAEEAADDEEVTKPEASEDENEEDPSHATSMRMRIKKIKEMIPLMFTDKDDVYVSSDDEETEKKLIQQRLYKKRLEQKAKLSSSTGNENSEEILRHIKKPEIGKKAKTSFKDRALMGINKNPAASKSSFLGKLTKSSISEGSRKRGSNVVRGYIFERDDSNSKSLNSVPEEPSVPETLQIVQEKSRPRRAPAKFTASQSQERSTTSQATTVEEEKSTRQRTTLYEILKMSSKKTSFTTGETVISSSHTESIFAAFKLDTKPVKSNPQR